MSETSQSSNSSQSTSSASPVQTLENDIINQISGTASQMAGQLYSWAQGVYAQTSAITNEAVGNFFQASQKMMGLSNSMIDQYNTLFAPENAELVADANSYDSPSRVEADMGMAGATAAQAGSAAEANATQQLQQYGIDPSSGRYASLLNADNVQNAANIAGAENTQRVADTQMGQTLRAEAVQTGAQLPSSIANVTNTGLQADTGAENAELANANTGVNLMNLPDSYLNTAMQVKMPFNAQKSQSSSLGGGSSNKSSPSKPSDSGGAGGAPGGGGAGQPGWDANHTAGAPSLTPGVQQGQAPYVPSDWDPSGINSGQTQASDFTGGNIYNPDPDGGNDLGLGNGAQSGFATQEQGGSGGVNEFGDPSTNFLSDQGSGMVGSDNGMGNNTPSGGYGGTPSTFGNMGGGTDTQFGNISQATDQNPTMPQGWQDPTVQTNWDTPPPAADSSASTDWSSSGDSGNQGNQDQTSYDDSGGSDFARGGPVPPRQMRRPPQPMRSRMPNFRMAGGGQVPQQASPSGGQRVDDVSAAGPGGAKMHLNANEFVIPRDVALWKGQEFFQNLIDQARKKNMMASAKPQAGPQPPRMNPPMGVQ